MGAVMNVDPSLINFLGGYGRAFGAIGKSMTDINQAKLDLDQQERDNTSKNAYLKLQQDYNDLSSQKWQAEKDNAKIAQQKSIDDAKLLSERNINTISAVNAFRGMPLGDVPQQSWGNTDPKLILDQLSDAEKNKISLETLQNNLDVAGIKERYQTVGDGTWLVDTKTNKMVKNPKTFAPKGSGGGGDGNDSDGGFPKVTTPEGKKGVLPNMLSTPAFKALFNTGKYELAPYDLANKNGYVGFGTQTYINDDIPYALIPKSTMPKK